MKLHQWIAILVMILTFTYSVNAQHDNDTTHLRLKKNIRLRLLQPNHLARKHLTKQIIQR